MHVIDSNCSSLQLLSVFHILHFISLIFWGGGGGSQSHVQGGVPVPCLGRIPAPCPGGSKSHVWGGPSPMSRGVPVPCRGGPSPISGGVSVPCLGGVPYPGEGGVQGTPCDLSQHALLMLPLCCPSNK